MKNQRRKMCFVRARFATVIIAAPLSVAPIPSPQSVSICAVDKEVSRSEISSTLEAAGTPTNTTISQLQLISLIRWR